MRVPPVALWRWTLALCLLVGSFSELRGSVAASRHVVHVWNASCHHFHAQPVQLPGHYPAQQQPERFYTTPTAEKFRYFSSSTTKEDANILAIYHDLMHTGFYVDLGVSADDARAHSNSYLLDRFNLWSGLCGLLPGDAPATTASAVEKYVGTRGCHVVVLPAQEEVAAAARTTTDASTEAADAAAPVSVLWEALLATHAPRLIHYASLNALPSGEATYFRLLAAFFHVNRADAAAPPPPRHAASASASGGSGGAHRHHGHLHASHVQTALEDTAGPSLAAADATPQFVFLTLTLRHPSPRLHQLLVRHGYVFVRLLNDPVDLVRDSPCVLYAHFRHAELYELMRQYHQSTPPPAAAAALAFLWAPAWRGAYRPSAL